MTGWTLGNQTTRGINNMKLLLLLLTVAFLSGCAYKGDVYLYSPLGAGNAIEKSVEADLDIPLLP